MLNRIISLIIKELQAIFRDKKTRIVLIGPPLMQLLIFSFAATLEVKNISIAILNKDSGKESQDLVHEFEGAPSFKKILFLKSESEIKDVLDSQKVIYVLQIDSMFSKNIHKGEPAKIQYLLDGRKSNVAQIALGYSTNIIEEYSSNLNVKKGNKGISST